MAAIIHATKPLTEAERNARIYAGDIIVFRGFRAVGELVDLLRGHCVSGFGDDPERVHERQPVSAIEHTAEHLRRAVRDDSAVNSAWRAALAGIGVAVEATYGDGVVLRLQTPAEQAGRLRTAPLAAHRDTWGSNIAAQTNWWAPLFATTAERTLALFPTYFDRPVANNSAGWDFDVLVQHRARRGAPAYPDLPTATETPPWRDGLPVSLVPGDLMCFAGAHLHASVPNRTDRTRLSFESRTVNGADVAAGRGAPNVDGYAPRTAYRLFRHLIRGQRLTESAVRADR